MNKYMVYVTGNDSIGFSFLKNCTTIANKGAKIMENKVPCMRFPYGAWFLFETEELMENTPGFQFQRIQELYTKEQLDEMSWDDFKHVLKRDFNITGRNRDLMVRQYLKAVGQESSEDSEEVN